MLTPLSTTTSLFLRTHLDGSAGMKKLFSMTDLHHFVGLIARMPSWSHRASTLPYSGGGMQCLCMTDYVHAADHTFSMRASKPRKTYPFIGDRGDYDGKL